MGEPISLTRTRAAELIEDLRTLRAQATEYGASFAWETQIVDLLRRYGIEPLTRCDGAAHDPSVGGMIDNCARCAPRWGWIGAPVKVR